MMIKKMRREVDELRTTLSSKNEEIDKLLDEKNLMHKENTNHAS